MIEIPLPTETIEPKEIVALRKALRWSRGDLAGEIVVAPLAISYWEEGRHLPRKKYVWILRRLLTVAVSLDNVRKEIVAKFPEDHP